MYINTHTYTISYTGGVGYEFQCKKQMCTSSEKYCTGYYNTSRPQSISLWLLQFKKKKCHWRSNLSTQKEICFNNCSTNSGHV